MSETQAVPTSPLPADFAALLLTIARDALAVRTTADYEALIKGPVMQVLPHDKLFSVIGEIRFGHTQLRKCVCVNWPAEWLSLISNVSSVAERPVIDRWLSTRAPVVVDDNAEDQAWISERELFEIQLFELGRIAVFGLPDIAGHQTSYFSFARVDARLSKADISQRLAMICPYLHQALLNVPGHNTDNAELHIELTEIEKELLRWLAAGRSNLEIAQLRQRSPATVRNQLEKLYAKLGVSGRAEAAALAASRWPSMPGRKL
jgi:DNA-binding CsgD family transcriptional regulator